MLICLLSIGTYFRLGSRCLHACGHRQFFDDDNLSAEYIDDGKFLINQGRRSMFDESCADAESPVWLVDPSLTGGLATRLSRNRNCIKQRVSSEAQLA
jgi:hypothetical protein